MEMVNTGLVSVNQLQDNVTVTPKSKLEWTPELHSIFMKAVINLGGIQKATPKNILNRMNVPELTRLNVASHLQKVRGFMKSGGHKRTNRLARNHQQFMFIQRRQLDDPALSNSSPHASYNRESSVAENKNLQGGGARNPLSGADFLSVNCDLLAGVLSFIVETEDVGGGDQENDIFGNLSPIWHGFGNSTAGQDFC